MKNGGYELGKTYKSYYWNQTFRVEKIHNEGEGNWFVTVLWQDGSTTTHCTQRGIHDKEVAA